MFLQAALHILQATDLSSIERDRNRNMDNLEHQYERYQVLKLKFVEQKEKLMQMEAQQARCREHVVEDFKKYHEFEDILNAEYNASFPNTFRTCWENVMFEIGKTIAQVT